MFLELGNWEVEVESRNVTRDAVSAVYLVSDERGHIECMQHRTTMTFLDELSMKIVY